jgi:hypothetical protein
MIGTVTPADAKELLQLRRSGRLYAIYKWIEEARVAPNSASVSPLAMDTNESGSSTRFINTVAITR